MYKKPKKSITPTLRQQIWDLHVGIGKKSALCPLCNHKTIYSSKINSGFEAAHIVADKWMGNTELTALYLFPSCDVCNNECSDFTVLDFLFNRGRIGMLRKVIASIYKAFCDFYENELPLENKIAPKVLHYLYGSDRFPAGGGIVNTKAIYEIARQVHLSLLVKHAKELSEQLDKTNTEIQNLLEYDIKPMKF